MESNQVFQKVEGKQNLLKEQQQLPSHPRVKAPPLNPAAPRGKGPPELLGQGSQLGPGHHPAAATLPGSSEQGPAVMTQKLMVCCRKYVPK